MITAPRHKSRYTLEELKLKIKEMEDFIGERTGGEFTWNYTLGEGMKYIMEYNMLLRERYYRRIKKP